MDKKQFFEAEQKSGEKKLDQFEKWEKFVDDKLWPITEKAIQAAQNIWNDINKKFESESLTKESIESFEKKLTKERKTFKSELEELYKVIETGYGPMAHIVLGMIHHDAPKMFDDIGNVYMIQIKNLKSEWSLDKIFENHGIDKEKFITRAGQAIAQSQESYKIQAKFITEAGESLKLDMQEIMSQPFKMAFGRLSEKEKEKYTWRVEIADGLKNEILPYENILNEILKEIIVNGIEAMKNGGDMVMNVRKEQDQFIIELENNGPLILKKDLDRIFKKGFTTKKTGTGHGLFYNKEFVEKIMNGSFEVKSLEGQGTKFIIKIPT